MQTGRLVEVRQAVTAVPVVPAVLAAEAALLKVGSASNARFIVCNALTQKPVFGNVIFAGLNRRRWDILK